MRRGDFNVKPRLPRMPGQRPRPSLVAAAQAQEDTKMDIDDGAEPAAEAVQASTSAVAEPPAPSESARPEAESVPVQPAASAPVPAAGPSSYPMVASTSNSDASSAPVSATPSEPAKMKFRPKMPIRRAAAEEVKVKVERGPTRGTPRGRGRGRGGARGGASVNTIAAGPFGGTRPTTTRRVIPPAPPRNYMANMTQVEVYSDDEDGTRTGVIDIDAVATLGESAPTSVYRDRDLDGGKAKAKAADKAKLKDQKRRKQAARQAREAQLAAGVSAGDVTIKAEPVSPLRAGVPLPSLDPAVGGRVADTMLPGDLEQDLDEEGRRMRSLTSGITDATDDVNEAQRVDLSESEESEYEEDMEGDFTYVPGLDNPEDKLFTFQFPPQFPKFVPRGPVDATGADTVPDVKPASSSLKKKHQAPPLEGRIGTLCVMKSGKVKMVFGEGDAGIVMNVTPGVPSTFLQQVVHLDNKAKATTVLGEVHKGYVVTPDLDRLLEELFINGGETPGDRERAQAEIERRVKIERGLVKMEPDSP